METQTKNPIRRDPFRLLGFGFKAYIILASAAYSWWMFNILSSAGERTEFVIRKIFSTLVIGFDVSISGLIVISIFQLVRKQTKEVGWNFLFVTFALIWLFLFAPVLTK